MNEDKVIPATNPKANQNGTRKMGTTPLDQPEGSRAMSVGRRDNNKDDDMRRDRPFAFV